MYAAGWRSGEDRFAAPRPDSATLIVLHFLAGLARGGWDNIRTSDALAATARAAIRDTTSFGVCAEDLTAH